MVVVVVVVVVAAEQRQRNIVVTRVVKVVAIVFSFAMFRNVPSIFHLRNEAIVCLPFVRVWFD